MLAKDNRYKLYNLLPNNCIAIIPSSSKALRNGDQFYFPFRQNSDFYYLTEITQPDNLLIIHKNNNGDAKSLLFIYTPSEKEKIYDGNFLTPQEALNISGVDYVYELSELKKGFLNDLIEISNEIFLCDNGAIISGELKNIVENIKQNEFTPLKPLLSKIRLLKSKEEIQRIKKAINITYEALDSVLTLIKNKSSEREIYAYLTAYYLSKEKSGISFDPIVASGKNAITLHYNKLISQLQDNELLLIDTGAEYEMYAGDITRVFPINGKFSKKQKQVYEEVLQVQRAMINEIKPGTTINELNEKANHLIGESLIRLGLVKKDEPEIEKIIKKYYPHGLSHFMGLDVHDVGTKDSILKPGMVLTCEPGLYIPEWEIGIRLEDDILVTENGNENLSANIPIYPEDIEKWMNNA
jgi:Xaa-Pro aminopeptidase